MHRPTSLLPLCILSICFFSASAFGLQTASVHPDQIQSTHVTSRQSTPHKVENKLSERLLTDGVKWTDWIANTADTTPTIHLGFRGTRYITAIDITGGCAATVKKFKSFSRPRTLLIESTMRSMTAQLTDRMTTQRIVVDPPMPTDTLRLQIQKTYAGAKSAVCISELQFTEMTLPSNVDASTIARITALIERLKSPEADDAIASLTTMGPTAIPMMLMALQHPNETQQLQVLETLRRVGSPTAASSLVALAKSHGNGPLTLAIVRALAATAHGDAIPVLNQHARSKIIDHALCAAKALRSFGALARPGLQAALKNSKNERATIELLKSLIHVGDPNALQTVRTLLHSDSAQIRQVATESLTQGTAAELSALTQLAHDAHPDVRHAVATTLRNVTHNRQTIELLVVLMNDPNRWVAGAAIDTLAQCPLAAAINVLARYLDRLNAPMGQDVVVALGKASAYHALPHLIQILQRGEIRYRRSAQRAIRSHGLTGMTAIFENAVQDSLLHDDAVQILAQHPQWTVALIGRYIQSKPASIPKFMVETLGETRDASALSLLNHLWNQGIHRAAVVDSLALIESPKVHARLIQILGNPDDHAVQVAAIQACGKAQIRQAIPQLHALLQSDQAHGALILETLGQLKDTSIVPYILSHFKTAPLLQRFAMLKTCHSIGSLGCTRLLIDAVTDHNREIQRQATRYLNDHRADVAFYMP